MPLIIETGEGVDGADSFITVAEFDQIQSDYYGSAMNSTDAHKEAALRRAWLFMGSLNWNVDYPTFDGDIPAVVQMAQAIFARVELATPESLQPSVTPGQQKILTRVGDIGWDYVGTGGVDAQRSVVTMGMDMLKPYLNGSGQTRFLARA